jgi:mono/diheme cytochrome c family protein
LAAVTGPKKSKAKERRSPGWLAASVLDTDRKFLRETLIGSRFLLCYTKNRLALPITSGGLVMSRISGLIFVVALLALTSGCTRTPESAAGFRLPDGDPIAGRQEFIYLQCHQCHTIPGETFAEIPDVDPPYVVLGGNVTRVKTYGELVTAIINPSHELAKGYAEEEVSESGVSGMEVYNDVMTVRQLTDLVVFLQPHYDVLVPKYEYRGYK